MSEKFDEKSKSLHEKMMDKKCSESASMKEIIDQERNPATKQSYRSVAIIKMAILGWSPKQISEYLGLTPQRVSTILNSKSGKDQVRIGQHEMFTKNPQQMFLDILPDAVNTAKRAMKDKKTTTSVRVDAAFKFMDRALGKPLQEIKHEGNAIRELFMALDRKNRGEDESGSKENAIDAEFKEVKSDVNIDPIDKWVDENL